MGRNASQQKHTLLIIIPIIIELFLYRKSSDRNRANETQC